MTSSYRVLERLPSEIFANLVEDHENEGQPAMPDPALLQRRICNKLKSFPRKIAGRIKQRPIKYVGEFLKLSEVDLVNGLDPLLTFGKRLLECGWL